MRIARFTDVQGVTHTGRMIDNAHAIPISQNTDGANDGSDAAVEIQRFLPPIEPPNIFAIGRNYREHIAETGARTPPEPLIFMKPTTTLLSHDEEIMLPIAAPAEIDFEAELALIVGKTAKRVSEENADDYILGYTCANDVSARDCQRNDKQWVRGKGFDSFCPIGPWIVTPDEFNPDNAGIRSRLNGEIMQDSNTNKMMHSCAKLLSYLSHQFTLRPGTVILTGTPEGVGFARKPPVFLREGDRIEIEIDGIGILSNSVVAERPR